MVNVSSPSDLANTLPVRPASPIAQRQQSEEPQIQKDQFVDRNDQTRLTSDQEIDRAVKAFQRDQNNQQQFLKEGNRETISDQYVEQFKQAGYEQTGSAKTQSISNANSRGQYFDIYT